MSTKNFNKKNIFTLSKLRDDILKCQKCPLKEFPHVPGDGSMNAKVLIVGEAPGKNEAELGLPFVGASGALLRLFLKQAGFEEDDYYITNAVKCRPMNNSTPGMLHIDACNEHLEREIDYFRPTVILGLGITASLSLYRDSTPSYRISDYRGLFYKNTFVGKEYDLFFTYHPAAALYDKSKESIILNDLKTLNKFLFSK